MNTNWKNIRNGLFHYVSIYFRLIFYDISICFHRENVTFT